MALRGNITHEPCTLVYTLLNDQIINFNDFHLIVRSLHSYMVDSIVPNPELKNVHVKLNYQASIANATSKLGALQSAVAVSKLSSFVKENEFSHLEHLRRRFGIGSSADGQPAPGPSRSTRPRGKRNYQRAFEKRPPRPTYTPVSETISDFEDGQADFYIGTAEEVQSTLDQ